MPKTEHISNVSGEKPTSLRLGVTLTRRIDSYRRRDTSREVIPSRAAIVRASVEAYLKAWESDQ